MVNWQESINPTLKLYVERVIKNSAENKNAIIKAKDKKTAQLWIALAQLSKELHESKARIKYLENILGDLLESKKKSVRSKKQKTEIDKLIKTLKKF
jgi:hypothetical protein